jgi:hypothetical protein
MMGQAIRGGTAFSQILLDDQALPVLLREIDVERGRLDQEEEGDLDQMEESRPSMDDPCALTQFQMNMVLPTTEVPIEMQLDEPDVEIDIVDA